MTTGISLVRENTLSMQPPRALWTSFPLGRPLGIPGDANFQHRVIRAALSLLEAPGGPVLVDYPEDIPELTQAAALSCPVSFTRPIEPPNSWSSTLLSEFQTLLPWYELGRHRRDGRTVVGVSASSVKENIQKIGALLDESRLPVESLRWFKAAIEDAKLFYFESLTAQPGNYDQASVEHVFWHETALGATLTELSALFLARPGLSAFARIVTPRAVMDASPGSQPQHSPKDEL